MKVNNLNKELLIADKGEIKNKKFLLNNVKVFNIVENKFKETNNFILNLNFSKTNIIDSIVNYKNVPFYNYFSDKI